MKGVCRERASRRWSSLLTQTKSRIGHDAGMRERLDESNWAAFVRFAEMEYKEDFFSALTPSVSLLACEGRIDGSPSPRKFEIDLCGVSGSECGDALPGLHMDHTHDVTHICQVWSSALPETPRSWDDGICGPLIAHLLFGTKDHPVSQCSSRAIWKKQIRLRCGNVRGKKGQKKGHFCYDLARAHYGFSLKVEDIRWPA